jgi:hypothetical protein
MFNKPLSRPMFRRGGRAGGGIMTGVERPGYDGESTDTQLVTEPTKVEQIGNDMTAFNKAFPQYNSAGSDFFMNLGSNILAAPGGNPILQTIGTAAKDPLLQMQKTNMANTQGNRELALKFWQSMDDDDKDAMINRAEQMVEAGRFKTVEEALQVLVPTFRKDQSPQETEREDILRDEKTSITQVDDLAKQFEIGRADAVVLNDFMNDLQAGKYEGVYHDPSQFFIEDDDVGRGTKEGENRLVIKDYNPEESDYKEGRVYVDFLTKIAYVKQGQYLIPYTDYISETIKTD